MSRYLPKAGTCRICGCTDDHACAGGCWWADTEHTLCSTCSGTDRDMAYTLRAINRLLDPTRDNFNLKAKTLTAHRLAGEAARRHTERCKLLDAHNHG